PRRKLPEQLPRLQPHQHFFLGRKLARSSFHRRQNNSAALSETDPAIDGVPAPAAQDHFIAVLQKRALFAVWKGDWLLAAPRQLEQAAAARFFGPGHRPAADQIAWADIASVRSVVRHH